MCHVEYTFIIIMDTNKNKLIVSNFQYNKIQIQASKIKKKNDIHRMHKDLTSSTFIQNKDMNWSIICFFFYFVQAPKNVTFQKICKLSHLMTCLFWCTPNKIETQKKKLDKFFGWFVVEKTSKHCCICAFDGNFLQKFIFFFSLFFSNNFS